MKTYAERSNSNADEKAGLRPLITFLLVAYNQEDYIEEAVRGAFSQTYSPLEIILSDDCSSDNTYAKIESLANSYEGPHKIIVNRNITNLGIGGHFNKCLELAKGEFIVASAGDDISQPGRVDKVYQAWTSANNINSVFSNLEKIDEHGVSKGPMFSTRPSFAANIEDFINNIDCWVIGASFSFEKRLFDKYGKLDPSVRQEDGCLAFRALLEGQISYQCEALVKYRYHCGNVSQSNDPSRRMTLQRNAYYMYRNWLYDARRSGIASCRVFMRIYWLIAKSIVVKCAIAIPLVGYVYNSMRLKLKLFLVRRKIIKPSW